MATVILTGTYFNQDLLAQEVMNSIIGDNINELVTNLNEFGVNTGNNTSGFTSNLNTDKTQLTFTDKVTQDEGSAEYNKNDTITFTGTGLEDLNSNSATYRLTKLKFSIAHNRSYDIDPKTTKKIPEKFTLESTIDAGIDSSGITVTKYNSSTTDVYTDSNNHLSWDPTGNWRGAETKKSTATVSGEFFSSWDNAFVQKDTRSAAFTFDYFYDFYNSSNKKFTNKYSVKNSYSSVDGFEIQAEGIGKDDQGNVTTWQRVNFDGIVDKLSISNKSTWAEDVDSPQFTGEISYISSEKNSYIADAFNSVFSDVVNATNLSNNIKSALLPALFFGNDKIKGNAGNIAGYDAPNTMNGYGGNDSITGANGADTLIGGVGKDTLTGGMGDDSFVFSRGDSAALSGRTDTISDFQWNITETLTKFGSDRIELDGLDLPISLALVPTANAKNFYEAKVKANNDFSVGNGCNISIQGVGTTKDAYLFADMNGDHQADLGIKLVGVLSQGSLTEFYDYMGSSGGLAELVVQ